MKYGGISMKTPNITITREVQKEIIYSLRKVGFPAHMKGYDYAKTALEIILNNPESIESITGELYPTIASIHQTIPSRVERALRHGIELIYDRNTSDDLNEILGPSIQNKGKLTNSEFLAVMAENIRMALDCLTDLKDEELPQSCKDLADDARLLQLRQDLIALGVIKG